MPSVITIESFDVDLSSEIFLAYFLFPVGKWKFNIANFIESFMINRGDFHPLVLQGSFGRRWLCLRYQYDIHVVL